MRSTVSSNQPPCTYRAPDLVIIATLHSCVLQHAWPTTEKIQHSMNSRERQHSSNTQHSQDLMRYLTSECKTRGATIVYATHIFDAMDRWPTHVAYLTAGRLTFFGSIDEFHKHMPTGKEAPQLYFASKLMTILAHWIRRDRDENLKKERLVWLLFMHSYKCMCLHIMQTICRLVIASVLL